MRPESCVRDAFPISIFLTFGVVFRQLDSLSRDMRRLVMCPDDFVKIFFVSELETGHKDLQTFRFHHPVSVFPLTSTHTGHVYSREASEGHSLYFMQR